MRLVRPLLRGLVTHGPLALSSFFMLAPFVWMILLSLKPPGEMFQEHFSILPHQFYAVENFSRAFTGAPMLRFLGNGLFTCGAILSFQLLTCAPCAYALAKLEFRGRGVVFVCVLLGLLIPQQALALPLFVLLAKARLLDSYAALILPFVVSPFGIFLLRQYFRTIPSELILAARLDGLSETAILWRIMLPLAQPAIVAFAVFSFVGHWNGLFWPSIAIRSEALMPPALGVLAFRDEETGSDYGPLMASAIIVVAPLIMAFLSAQRWFVNGLTAGAVK